MSSRERSSSSSALGRPDVAAMTSTGETMTKGAKDAEDVGPPPAPVDWNKKNPLKALFFAQVSPLIAEGTVRRLEPTDLCHLEKLDSERVRL